MANTQSHLDIDTGLLSGGNSTTTPLAGGATFTGKEELNQRHQNIGCSCKTDADGTLYFDFSNDGENWDTFPSNGFEVNAGVHEFHVAVKLTRWFRVRLVNGSDAQSYLRLYCYYGDFRQGSAPLNQVLGLDADAKVVRSLPPEVDLGTGKLGGVTQRDKFGYSEGLGTAIQLGTPSTWVDIWTYGGQRTSPTSSFTGYIASSDNSDTSDVSVLYQDANGEEQTQIVTLNGQTPVSLGTMTECYRAFTDDSTATAGTVYVTSANNFTSGVPDNQNEVLCAYSANDQQTQVLAFRVPSNKRAIINLIDIALSRSSGSGGAADVTLDIREDGKVWRSIRKYQVTTESSYQRKEVIALDALTDVRVRVRDVSDTNSAISGFIGYLLVDT